LRYFVFAGLFAAVTVASELPALALFAALSAALLWRAPRQTISAYLPAALVVAAGFFGTNWIAHHSLKPPYMYQRTIVRLPVEEDFRQSFRGALSRAVTEHGGGAVAKTVPAALQGLGQDTLTQAVIRSGREAVAEAIGQMVDEALTPAAGEAAKRIITQAVEQVDRNADRPDNWYDYAYQRNGRTRDSYWRDPQGIDQAKDPPAVYALHVLIGHHGIFSLTPVWLLSAAGAILWLRRRQPRHLQELALLITGVTLVCLAFYLYPSEFHRNYGGMASGFRWMFWFAPLWLVVMLPAADAMGRRWWTRVIALLMLVVSVLSASYPTWNPWTLPWIMDYLRYLNWIG
jgi:hypothetical protein